MFKTYFKLKISKSKIFSGTLSFLAQMVKNWQSQKILDGIDSDFFKTYLNLNSRNRKFFPCKMISVILSLLAKIAKKWQCQKFWSIFCPNGFRMFQSEFYTENLKVENFTLVKISFWDLIIFGQNGQKFRIIYFVRS